MLKENRSRFTMNAMGFRNFIAISASLFLAGCTLIARHDQAAYEHATSAKVDTLALISKATGSYDDHEKEVEALVRELDKAYEYDRGRQLNKLTVAQWDILRDPNRDLVGGFLKMWKAKGSLSATFIAEKKTQIADAFDQIIQLESGKPKAPK
jgi:outer membrane murein-binding lipoprotein Lpp